MTKPFKPLTLVVAGLVFWLVTAALHDFGMIFLARLAPTFRWMLP